MPINNEPKHKHNYNDLRLVSLVTETRKEYTGSPRAFLAYLCECGDVRVFDYGDRKAMQQKFKDLGGEDTKIVTWDEIKPIGAIVKEDEEK